jgi:hypothetical protein
MDYREIARLKSSPAEVRAIAKGLLTAPEELFSSADRRFLEEIARREDGTELSTRQGEYLVDLRARATRRSVVARYRVSDLVARMWAARLDLDEDQQDWLGELFARGHGLAVSELQWRRICAMARRLGLIDDDFIPFRA